MATEIVTNWPLENLVWRQGTLTGNFEDQVLKRLGAIEEAISRIEKSLTESRGPASE